LEPQDRVIESGASNVVQLRARPPREALSWAISALGRESRLVSVRPLLGGISSAVHGLVVDDGDARHRVVMRRWLGQPQAEVFVRREASALSGLTVTPIPAPRLVAVDASGETAGSPALLMEWLPGRVDLAPRDPAGWLGQLARVLRDIHAVRIEVPLFDEWPDRSDRTLATWSSRPRAWEHAAALLGERPPTYEPHFLHGDFQHFNILWSRRRLSGVIDWTFSSVGPRELDTGHCRLNLAVLFSVDWAERFRRAYETEAGCELDPWWDLHALASYGPDWPSFIPLQVGGRAPLDVVGMHARVDELLVSVLRRI